MVYLYTLTHSPTQTSGTWHETCYSESNLRKDVQCWNDRCFCRGFLLGPIEGYYGEVENHLASGCACLQVMSQQPTLHLCVDIL